MEHCDNESVTLPNGTVTRRGFLKYCGAVAAVLGLGPAFAPRIAEALTGDNRPAVAWLNFSECTGCSESFLKLSAPSVQDIVLDTISLDYHETLMIAAGIQATQNLDEVVANHAGEFIAVVEGAIPTAQNGIYGTIGGKTMLQIAKDVLPKAKAVICYGTCASYGGLPAAGPNPTGAKGVKDAIGVNTINIPGCPPIPLNLTAVIANYLLKGTLPPVDAKGRPTFAFGSTVHANCPKPWGCLDGYNCKGRQTYGNCATTKFNDGTSWCIQVEHQCIGCTEPNFWDVNAPFYNPMWQSMFATYRKNVGQHPMNPAATCTPCHGSSTYASNRTRRGTGYSLWAHQEHEINVKTNTTCGNCHSAPGGGKAEIDD